MLKKLKKFRVDKDMKSKEMAEILGMSAANYSNMENGRSKVTFENFCKFEDKFPEVEKASRLFRK